LVPGIRPPRLRDDRATQASPAAGDLAGQPEYCPLQAGGRAHGPARRPERDPVHRYGEISERLYLDYATGAGLIDIEILDITNDFFRFYRLVA
jgi:hypothetical protein